MKKTLLLIACISFSSILDAQIMFQKMIGGWDYTNMYSLTPCNDGGYLIGGYMDDSMATNRNAYLVKINSFGDTLWTRGYGGGGTDDAWYASQTWGGGFFSVGSTSSFGAGSNDIYVINTDSTGNLVWSKTYGTGGNEQCFAAKQTSDGGYIVTGAIGAVSANNLLLLKVDSSGNFQWARNLGGTFLEQGYSVSETTDGAYVVAGITSSYGVGMWDVWLLKISSSGSLLWTKTYGGTDSEWATSVVQTNDGGFILSGYTGSFGAGNTDAYLIKTDSVGNHEWSKTFGGSNADYAHSAIQTSDGGYMVSGYTINFSSGHSAYLIKTDSAGNLTWSKLYTQAQQFADTRSSVLEAADGGFMMAICSDAGVPGTRDIYYVKTDVNGNSGCNEVNPPTVVTTPATFVMNPTVAFTSPVFTTGTPATLMTDGSDSLITYCNNFTTELNELEIEESAITLWPNPVVKELQIKSREFGEEIKIEIYNVLGEKKFQSQISNLKSQISVDVRQLSSGIYFLKVYSEKEVSLVKFIKEQ